MLKFTNIVAREGQETSYEFTVFISIIIGAASFLITTSMEFQSNLYDAHDCTICVTFRDAKILA